MNTHIHKSALTSPESASLRDIEHPDLPLPHLEAMSTKEKPAGHSLINIFVLPDQTKILVVLLTLSIYSILIAISAISSAPFWPIVLALFFLSLRSLLSWPERECRKRKLVLADKRFQELQNTIEELSTQLELMYVPQLMIAPGDATPSVFGSWRRWYIQIGEQYAASLLKRLCNPTTTLTARAVFLHELQHFKHGDTVWNGYARALLRTSVGLIGWATSFLLGWALLLILAQDYFITHSPVDMAQQFEALLARQGVTGVDIPSDMFLSMEEWEELRERVSQTDYGLLAHQVFLNTFALSLITGGLLLFLWRKLLRTREFYADAGVVHVQRDMTPLMQVVVQSAIQEDTSMLPPWVQRARHLWGKLWVWLPTAHPTIQHRQECLRDPGQVYGSWFGTAALIGLFVMVIELLLAGTSALFYYGNWPLHFPVLAIVLLVSLFMVVSLVEGRSVWRESLKIVTVAFIPHILLLLLTLVILWLLLLMLPAYLEDMLDTAASSIAGYIGLNAGDAFSGGELFGYVAGATFINLLQVPVMVLLTLGTVWLNIWLVRHILTWYQVGTGQQQIMRIVYGAISFSSLVLAFGVLPIVTDIVLLRFEAVFSPWLWLMGAAALLTGGAGGTWFWHQHRLYACKCPHCGANVSGIYHTGRACATCHHTLHPWLLVNYARIGKSEASDGRTHLFDQNDRRSSST